MKSLLNKERKPVNFNNLQKSFFLCMDNMDSMMGTTGYTFK